MIKKVFALPNNYLKYPVKRLLDGLFSPKFGWLFFSLTITWSSFILYLWYYIFSQECLNKSSSFIDTVKKINPEYWKTFPYFLTTLAGGPIGIYLIATRTKVAGDQLEADRLKSQNDTFVKSVELLGNQDVAVRQGAIFALSNIAKNDIKHGHEVIFKILVSFVKSNSMAYLETRNLLNTPEYENIKYDDISKKAKLCLLKKSKLLPTDVESALYVIRDRVSKTTYEESKYEENIANKGYLFDMSNAYLLNVDLDKASFKGFNLSDSIFEDCSFSKTIFTNSLLVKTIFKKSDLTSANFENCDLTSANFEDCDLSESNLSGAILINTNLSGREDSHCNLMKVKGLKSDQIEKSLGNEYTSLPSDISRPKSWGNYINP